MKSPCCKADMGHFNDYGVEFGYCNRCGKMYDEGGGELPDREPDDDEYDITDEEIRELDNASN